MKRATLTLILLVLLALALLSLNTTAQDTPDQDTAGETTAASPAESEEELESFVPTEKLPADSAISFPVDI